MLMAPSAMADLRVTGHDNIDPIDPPSLQNEKTVLDDTHKHLKHLGHPP